MLGLGTAVNRGGFVASDPLLLDPYSAPAAAYSLRKLSSSYSGPAFQIRRVSDNVEVNVDFDNDGVVSLNSRITNVTEETSGSLTNLTTSAGNLGQFVANAGYTDPDGLGSTDSAAIQCWYDQSGNSNDATQNTAADQPQLISNGSFIEEDGKPCVFKAAQSQALDIGSSLVHGADFLSAIVHSDFSAFGGVMDGPDMIQMPRNIGNYRVDFDAAVVNNFASTSPVNVITDHVVVIVQRVGTTSASLFANGNQPSNGTLTAGTTVTRSLNEVFGSANDITAKLQEYIFWGFDQSANRTAIETDINNFYSIF